MAIQRITVAKVAGVAGAHISEKVRKWADLGARSDEDERIRPGLVAQVSSFVQAFRANATSPPVLYFAEYIDQWSVGFSQLRWFPMKCTYWNVQNCGASIAAYELPDSGKLRRHVSRKLNHWHGEFDEDRWFLSHLRDAIGMYSKIVPSATIVILRESWSSSPDDEEVIASAVLVPDWLSRCV